MTLYTRICTCTCLQRRRTHNSMCAHSNTHCIGFWVIQSGWVLNQMAIWTMFVFQQLNTDILYNECAKHFIISWNQNHQPLGAGNLCVCSENVATRDGITRRVCIDTNVEASIRNAWINTLKGWPKRIVPNCTTRHITRPIHNATTHLSAITQNQMKLHFAHLCTANIEISKHHPLMQPVDYHVACQHTHGTYTYMRVCMDK